MQMRVRGALEGGPQVVTLTHPPCVQWPAEAVWRPLVSGVTLPCSQGAPRKQLASRKVLYSRECIYAV